MSLVCPVAASIKVQWKMSRELVTISRDMIDCEGTVSRLKSVHYSTLFLVAKAGWEVIIS